MTSLSFTIAPGPCCRVILGTESRGTRDHVLLSQIRDFLLSPPTNRRATVEVFDPASAVSNSSYIVVVQLLLVKNLLPSNGCFFCDRCLETDVYMTINYK
jgi:hypothetical protein